ncbi:MAG: hypothetical protein RIS47_329 [Bacteroidota bacterium]
MAIQIVARYINWPNTLSLISSFVVRPQAAIGCYLIEIQRYPVGFVPERVDYKRISSSCRSYCRVSATNPIVIFLNSVLRVHSKKHFFLEKNIRENNYHVFKVLYIIKIRAFVANILFRVDS